jgi:integrase/recombinase XerC
MKKGTREELADFLRFCRSERRLAAMTCAAYERDVSACLDYLQGQGIAHLAEMKVTHLRAFLADEQKRRPAVSSQARTTAALKSFFRFLVEEERLIAIRHCRCGRRRSGRRCRTFSRCASSSGYSSSPAGTTSGSATSLGSRSATGFCSR